MSTKPNKKQKYLQITQNKQTKKNVQFKQSEKNVNDEIEKMQ